MSGLQIPENIEIGRAPTYHDGRIYTQLQTDEIALLDGPPYRDEPFWPRHMFWPTEAGTDNPSFHNLPALGMGIIAVENGAVLSVPTTPWLNDVLRRINPDGFMMVEIRRGLLRAKKYLGTIAAKQLPWSMSQLGITFSSVRAQYNFGDEDDQPEQIITNYHEHDVADHGGDLALPGSEVDTLAEFAEKGLMLDRSGRKASANSLDILLSLWSTYATLPIIERPSTSQVQRKLKLEQDIVSRGTGLAQIVFRKTVSYVPDFRAVNDNLEKFREPVLDRAA